LSKRERKRFEELCTHIECSSPLSDHQFYQLKRIKLCHDLRKRNDAIKQGRLNPVYYHLQNIDAAIATVNTPVGKNPIVHIYDIPGKSDRFSPK